jgi:nucleoside-diphosphate-sugar epimerase
VAAPAPGSRPRPTPGPSGGPARGTVLVTGGTGFLGRAVVGRLRDAGRDVRTLQRSGADGAGSVAGDVRDPEAVARAVRGVEAIVHAAGLAHVFGRPTEAPFDDVNARGTDVVARAAVVADVRRLVLISTVAVYGDARPAHEDAAGRPAGPYAASKAAAEARAIAALSGSPVRLTVLRLATLYGDGDPGNVQRLLRAIERGRFAWIGGGENAKTLLHVDDAARACVLALDGGGGAKVEVYNVAAAPVTMRAVVEELARALERPVPSWHVPLGLARAIATGARVVAPSRSRALADALARWASDDVYPGDKFARRFDFEPRVAVADGLRRQVAWSRRATC